MDTAFYKLFCFTMLLSFFAISCSSDDDGNSQETPPVGDYGSGTFVLNEGGFGSSNASVSFLNENGQIHNGIFSLVNNRNLGDVAQSMGFNGDNAYIVVNNSATVEVVDRYTFQHIATVSEMIVNPRYIVFENNKGYISDLGDPTNSNDDFIAILNLETNLVEAKIAVVEGPEQMVAHNGKIYVAHKGGYSYGNTISVIDVVSQSVTASIAVAHIPDGMVIHENSMYVLCTGKPYFSQDETLGVLFKINLATNTVEASLEFPEEKHPTFLEFESNSLYYVLDSAIYTVALGDFQLSQNPVFLPAADGVETLYGFKVNDGKFYIGDAKDYASNGEAFIFNMDGDFQQKFSVGILPNSFYFDNE